MKASHLEQAIVAWKTILGESYLITEDAQLKKVATATYATQSHVIAILQPADRAELQACLEIAQQHRVPFYPISRGKNWGLGSSVPVLDQSVLLDLQRLNRIIDYNETLAYITVEPGVTFAQAQAYLQQNHSRLLLSATGGPMGGSLIGNLADGGDGAGPYGNRLEHLADLEIVLPTGEVIHTGHGRFGNAQTAAVNRSGVGPSLEGLFTQSNLGTITRATFWLMPIPDYISHYQAQIEPSVGLAHVVEALRPLFLHRILENNSVTIWNAYKFVASKKQHPLHHQPIVPLLDFSLLDPPPNWRLSGSIYGGSEMQITAIQQQVTAALQPCVIDLKFTTQQTKTMELGDPALLFPQPNDNNIRSVYWRKKQPPPAIADPNEDRCGVVWLCVALPAVGDTVQNVAQICETHILQHQFEPNLSFMVNTPRSIHLAIAILYDRDKPKADAQALTCCEQLQNDLMEIGYYPFRLGIHNMLSLPSPVDDYQTVLQKIKQALDPHQLQAPGRYEG